MNVEIRELFTPREAAEALKVQATTLSRWDRQRRWPPGAVVRTVGGHRRYAADVIRGIGSGTIQWPEQ